MDKTDKKEAAKKLLQSFKERKKLTTETKDQVPENRHPIENAFNIPEPVMQNSTIMQNHEIDPVQFFDNIGSVSVVETDNNKQLNNVFTPQIQNQLEISQNGTDNIESNDNFSVENDDTLDDNIFSQVELAKVCKQLEFHKKTVEFLVMEKNELVLRVGELESLIGQMKSNVKDSNGRLNISRHRISNLELENYNMRQRNQQLEAQVEKLTSDILKYQSQDVTIKTQYKDVNEELQEAKSLLNAKIAENKQLTMKIDDLTFRINSGEFHFQESSNPQAANNENLQEQIQYLTKQLQEVEIEKTQSNMQYQQYVEQLNIQIQSMKQRQDELESENERMSIQETSLMESMNSLEKQLQMQIQRSQPQNIAPSEPQISKEEFENVRVNCNQLMEELKNKNIELQKVISELTSYQLKVEELTEAIQVLKSETPDVYKLNAANESDRLAAQKATSQNAQLKLDVEHLQEAYDEMTQDKLELTELLQAEKELSKALMLKLAENEETYKNIHNKLIAKDEEMIRLQAVSSELQKEILKKAQVEDRLHHYEAQDISSDSLQSELQLLQRKVASLASENERLKSNIIENGSSDHSHENGGSCDHSHESHTIVKKDELAKKDETVLCKTEAMGKLEEKFVNLMKEVADLNDDKQKLEHLVVQLQAETETICEYIALYQKQRRILKQKENEKNAQLSLLAKERQNMKEQLDHLNSLVRQLVHRDNTNDANKLQATNSVNDEAIQTADRIMDLLSEIKTSHLIEPNPDCKGFNNIHHCTWCSGELITV